MNRFKGFELVSKVPEELWIEVHNIVQEILNKTIPKKKKCKKTKRLPEEALQRAENRKEVNSKEKKGKVYPNECRVPENSKERQEGLLQQTMLFVCWGFIANPMDRGRLEGYCPQDCKELDTTERLN